MRFLALIFAAILFPLSTLADTHQFADGESVVVRPDMAYVLVRSFDLPGGGLHGTSMFMPVLVRVLNAEELKSANDLAQKDPDHWNTQIESNVLVPFADHPYLRKDKEAFMVVALKPGVYVLGGVSVGNWVTVSSGVMVTSLCMGTVKFEAKAGVITDLGAILTADDDKPTTIPELANVVSGKDRGFGPVPPVVGLRPATASMEMPDALKAFSIVPADYRAVGAYPNFIGARLSRLAPVAGVLEYDMDGQVIDLRAGSKATP
jgi:hypothetical protein